MTTHRSVHGIAFLLIGIAAAIRLMLAGFGWPILNSDEATVGLMASHIANHAERPVFLYGQSYMGSLEAYLSAPLFHLVPYSPFALRCSAVLLFSLFLGSTYLLARKLYETQVALISLALLTLGSQEMLYQQIQTVGRLETLLFGSLAILLATCILEDRYALELANRRRLLLLYAAWGLVAGLGIWSDMEVVPFLLASGSLLLLFPPPRLRRMAVLIVCAALPVGAGPLIAYDLASSPGSSALPVLSQIYRSGGTGQANIRSSPLEGLEAAFLVTLPTMTGANAVCVVNSNTAWPLTSKTSSHTVGCTVVHGAWSSGIVVLWLISMYLAIRSLRRAEGREIPASRLALLAAAALLFLLYAVSPAASHVPWYSRRYLTPLWVATPALVWPLVLLTRARLGALRLLHGVPAYLPLAAVAFVLALGTSKVFARIRDFQWWNNRQYSLVADLERLHATRIYSDYWSCDRIIFQSHERVLCGVLGDALRPGENRYPRYATEVERAAHPFYVFPTAAAQNAVLRQQLVATDTTYRTFSLYGYTVYEPAMGEGAGATAANSIVKTQRASFVGTGPKLRMNNNLTHHPRMEPAVKLEGSSLVEDESDALP